MEDNVKDLFSQAQKAENKRMDAIFQSLGYNDVVLVDGRPVAFVPPLNGEYRLFLQSMLVINERIASALEKMAGGK